MPYAQDQSLIPIAALYAEAAHEGQFRKYTGGAYIEHPRRVAAQAAFLGLPYSAICAAYLHDVVEDCNVSPLAIEATFGSPIFDLVMLMTDLQTPEEHGGRAERHRAFLRQVETGVVELPDKRKLYLDNYDEEYMAALHTLKILDITDNAKSIAGHDPKFWHSAVKGEAAEALDKLELAHPWAKKQLRRIVKGGK